MDQQFGFGWLEAEELALVAGGLCGDGLEVLPGDGGWGVGQGVGVPLGPSL